MHVTFDVHELAQALWTASGRYEGTPDEYVDKSREMHRRWIAETAYFRWLNRGSPMGDAWADWFAAEAEYALRATAAGDVFAPDHVRQEALEVAAYHEWLRRGRVNGDPDTDWRAAETRASASEGGELRAP
ncbi:DUF2934 domain-containing protein [Streptomyces sp. NRRL B-1347]|uniref:DUF2934 domain-containing protein n=1 Tax=Streptomyces sp. NRRL B-1347 TaxID=1476877 RepID=UPI0004CC310F|nr:DUF2934 domain-containing protein [Streptomyces sp. NRRL B-1347]